MGFIRDYPDRITVSLGILDLLAGPVMLDAKDSKRIHVLKRHLREVVLNMLWSRLWQKMPELAKAKLYKGTTLVFNKETSSLEATWHKFPTTEGSHVGDEKSS